MVISQLSSKENYHNPIFCKARPFLTPTDWIIYHRYTDISVYLCHNMLEEYIIEVN